MPGRRNQIPSTSETNLYFANNMLIAFCAHLPAIFLHSAGKVSQLLTGIKNNPNEIITNLTSNTLTQEKSILRFGLEHNLATRPNKSQIIAMRTSSTSERSS